MLPKITVCGAAPANRTVVRRAAAMQRESFEYLTDTIPEREMMARLSELGSEGWELVTAHWEEYSFGGRMHMQARCIFKRRVPVDTFTETLRALGVS